MRETIFFFASTAGACVPTALAILIPPESLFWRVLLYGGIVVLFVCALALLIDIIRRRRARLAPLRETASPAKISAERSGLWISIGTDRPFETVKNGLRTIRIKLENRTDVPVSNCSVHVRGLKPAKKYSDFLLKNDIRIPARHHEFVDVSFYPETPPGKYVRFAIPLNGGFFAEAYDFATLPVGEYTLNLRAETIDGLYDEVACRLWVGPSGKLRLESLTGAPHS